MCKVKTFPPITNDLLTKIVSSLRTADLNIVAIVLFGSAVYAPDLARDIDLLVITREPKDWEHYLDAALKASEGWDVDIVVRKVGEKVGRLNSAVRAFGRLIWGDERWLQGVIDAMPVPTFEDARRTIGEAEADAREAMTTRDEWHADRRWRSAFNWLFEAARLAAMAFLNTDEGRWGVLRGQLPQPFNDEFRAIANALHIRFWYEGDYPHENTEWHFQTWRDRVAQFIADLEREAQSGTP
ncbi:MAG: nucleotidyltransferase domain-containing protein [Armatimonadetes bacterium]|nr:nucleotidyltransferase domain-containing protein [Armatimonadota bacterium]MCX7969680.1 nucleotidyltransferase domain-containing protein [Armatimonadota bacterium]MDW8144526.1 nucleotidyltransferase domain-containing protein [Armatimonadota bacterium]